MIWTKALVISVSPDHKVPTMLCHQLPAGEKPLVLTPNIKSSTTINPLLGVIKEFSFILKFSIRRTYHDGNDARIVDCGIMRNVENVAIDAYWKIRPISQLSTVNIGMRQIIENEYSTEIERRTSSSFTFEVLFQTRIKLENM